jgi:xanthine dehydrogenase YagT iron-sulfur-binding subunit
MPKPHKKSASEEQLHSDGHSRRAFLLRLGAAGVAATARPLSGLARSPESKTGQGDVQNNLPGLIPVALRVNGQEHHIRIDPRTTLLDCLRVTLHLTGSKKGCDHGQCGACTVHVNGRRINSCLTFAAMHQNEITTIEGIGQPGHLHAMQAAFVQHDGYQCGYCTSG